MTEWEEAELGEYCEFQEGYVNPSKQHPKYFGGDVKWCRAVDLTDGYVYETSQTLTEEGFKSAKKSALLFEPNTIVISKSGTIGRLGIIKDFMCGNRATINIKPKKNADTEFIFYLLRNRQKEFANLAVGSVQKNLYVSILEKIKFRFPDLETQRKIASYLGAIDKKIEVNSRINRNLLDQGRALYEDLISKYEINAKLSDLISSIETGSRPKGGAQESGVPSIGAEKIESFGVYDYSGEKYISEEFFEKSKRGHILSGDVLLYKDGAYTGKTSMALNDFPHAKCAINEHVYKLNSNNNLYQFFLYFTLDNKKNRDYIYTLASSKAAQPGLNQTELLSVDIAMPVETSLIEFEKNVSEMMNMIASNAKENRKLTLLRDSLLPKLMSGEIDVSELDV